MDRVESSWCKLGVCIGEPTWRTANKANRPLVCDNFWHYFDWNRPKKGQQLRLVFSSVPVRGAQKTLVRNDLFSRVFILGPCSCIGIYVELDKLLKNLEPRELFEFYVWWWPEYREGTE